MTETSVTLCAIARDEGPYLLEWIGWHKLLGIQRIVIYDNESRDQSAQILSALHRVGEIQLHPWPDQAGEQPQVPAYRDAIARCPTDWIGFLDIDEFLVLHRHPHLTDLLSEMPEECSAVVFNQRFFGSSDQQFPDDRLVIERFIRAPPPNHPLNAWVKTVARTQKIAGIDNPHCCALSSGYYADPGGGERIVEGYSCTREISFDVGQYNHYILKSREEYARKRARGRGTVASDDPTKHAKYSERFFAMHDQNQKVDDSALRKASIVRQECNRLREICGI